MSTLRTNNIESLDGQSNATVTDLAKIPSMETAIENRTIYVGSVAELEGLPSPIDGQEALVKGTPFKYDGAQWQLSGGFVYVESFGASPDSADNTAAYNDLIAWVPSGTKVIWGYPSKTYIGNFISVSKSLICNLNGATLTDFTATDSICAIGSLQSVTEYDVVESVLTYGTRTFQVVGASSLFAEGDIGYLWDGAIRPTGGDVNFETVKIKSVNTDVVTVDGFIASHKGAAGIKFYHSADQLKGAQIYGGKIAASNQHVTFGAGIFNAETVKVQDIETENTTGNAVGVRYCYDVTVERIRPRNPRLIGSGQGYGVAFQGVTQFTVRDIAGIGCRHAFLEDSAYFGSIERISDPMASGVPADLAHNGFAGNITLEGVEVRALNYAVAALEQGYGGTPGAEKKNHPFRNIRIRNINNVVPSEKSPEEFGVSGVYMQNYVIDTTIENVSVRYESTDTITTATGSSLVRIGGPALGTSRINGISCNKVGDGVRIQDEDATVPYEPHLLTIENVSLGECEYPIRAFGRNSIAFDKITLGSAPISKQICVMFENAGLPVSCTVGNTINGDDALTEILATDATGLLGVLPTRTRFSYSSVTLSAGYAITQSEVQQRSASLRLKPPVGTATTILSATDALPAPVVEGAELYLFHSSTGRDSVEFPAGNNIAIGFTINPEESMRLVSRNNKWRMVARSIAA